MSEATTGETLDLDEWADDTGKFAMQVTGEAMIEEHIADGDFVIIQRQCWASNGQVVVVKDHEGEPCLRRYYRDEDGFRLVAANKTVPTVKREKVEILGVLIGIVRKY